MVPDSASTLSPMSPGSPVGFAPVMVRLGLFMISPAFVATLISPAAMESTEPEEAPLTAEDSPLQLDMSAAEAV
jgi:hypothetical protein